MKKNVVIILMFGLLNLGITGCKDDEPTFSTERPITAFYDDNTISDPLSYDEIPNSASYWEFGFEFTVTKNGDIIQLGTKIPDNDNVRVTIWDLADTTVIAQKVITATDGVATFADLASNVALSTGNKYAVTMYGNDYYFRVRTGGAVYVYPYTSGNVSITKFVYGARLAAAPATYPLGTTTAYISGLQDFSYKTED